MKSSRQEVEDWEVRRKMKVARMAKVRRAVKECEMIAMAAR